MRKPLHFVSKSCDFAPRDINASCEIRLQTLTFKEVLEREQNSESEGDETLPLLLAPLCEGLLLVSVVTNGKTELPQSARTHADPSLYEATQPPQPKHLLLPALMTNSIYSTFWLRYRCNIPFTVPLSSILKWLKTAPIFSPYQCEPVLF